MKITDLVNFFDNRIHKFDNGLKVYKKQLIPLQVERYSKVNLHEPLEEKWFLDIVHNLKSNKVFVDVGSAIGYYSMLAKLQDKEMEVYAFEPQKEMRRCFEKNKKLNTLEDIVIIPYAISNEIGLCDIDEGYGEMIKNGNSIKQITIDHFMKDFNKNIGLIKLDIQGVELKALEGAIHSLDRINNWIVGTHSKELHQECINFLKKNNYHISLEDVAPEGQPDGLIVAQRNIK